MSLRVSFSLPITFIEPPVLFCFLQNIYRHVGGFSFHNLSEIRYFGRPPFRAERSQNLVRSPVKGSDNDVTSHRVSMMLRSGALALNPRFEVMIVDRFLFRRCISVKKRPTWTASISTKPTSSIRRHS